MEGWTAPAGLLFGLTLLVNGPLQAQSERVPGVRHAVLPTEPAEAEVDAALDAVKAQILSLCWDDKCDDSESRRRKYLDDWQAVVSDHYVVFTNGPTATCKKYAVTLEKLYDLIQDELPFDDPDRLLVAYIFADREDYYRYSQNVTGWSEQAARATAGHANSSFYATYYTSPRDPVVYHEAAHEIVGACLKVPGVGSWFQEGLAVYFEKKMSNQRLDTCRSAIKRGDCYPLEELIALPSLLGDPKGNGHRNYDHAGALLDFLINTKKEPVAGRFEDFLAAARIEGHGFVRGPKVAERLIEKVYGTSIEELEGVWMQHLRIRR